MLSLRELWNILSAFIIVYGHFWLLTGMRVLNGDADKWYRCRLMLASLIWRSTLMLKLTQCLIWPPMQVFAMWNSKKFQSPQLLPQDLVRWYILVENFQGQSPMWHIRALEWKSKSKHPPRATPLPFLHVHKRNQGPSWEMGTPMLHGSLILAGVPVSMYPTRISILDTRIL